MTMKDAKKGFITDVARDLFFRSSINDVTVKDIALSAGVGEATVYRYFTHKQNVVVAVAEKLEKEVYSEYFAAQKSGNGYARIKAFFENYVKVFATHPAFFKFVNEFDAYMLSEDRSSSEEYSIGIDLFKDVFFAAYEDGVKDGSVKKIKNPETFYFAATHALLELCKKLSTGIKIVKQDETTDKVAEISELKDVILFYIATVQA